MTQLGTGACVALDGTVGEAACHDEHAGGYHRDDCRSIVARTERRSSNGRCHDGGQAAKCCDCKHDGKTQARESGEIREEILRSTGDEKHDEHDELELARIPQPLVPVDHRAIEELPHKPPTPSAHTPIDERRGYSRRGKAKHRSLNEAERITARKLDRLSWQEGEQYLHYVDAHKHKPAQNRMFGDECTDRVGIREPRIGAGQILPARDYRYNGGNQRDRDNGSA